MVTDLILKSCLVLVGAYWAGAAMLQNPSVADFVGRIEDGYGRLNDVLRQVPLASIVPVAIAICGRMAFGSFALMVGLSMLGSAGDFWLQMVRPLFYLATIAAVGFAAAAFSLSWCFRHRETVAKVSYEAGLLVSLPLVAGVIQSTLDVPLVEPFHDMAVFVFTKIGLDNEVLTSPMALGLFGTLILTFWVALYYLISWLAAAPIAIFLLALISLPILFARLLHRIWPKKAFVGLSFAIFTICTYFL